jgi:hypothetical protein
LATGPGSGHQAERGAKVGRLPCRQVEDVRSTALIGEQVNLGRASAA